MEESGIITLIYDERRISDTFKIREFVMQTGQWSPYPQKVIFQAVNNAIIQLLDLYAGDQVKVYFNLRGKYGAPPTNGGNHLPFNRLEVWRIIKSDKE